jgi:hypothetical protein
MRRDFVLSEDESDLESNGSDSENESRPKLSDAEKEERRKQRQQEKEALKERIRKEKELEEAKEQKTIDLEARRAFLEYYLGEKKLEAKASKKEPAQEHYDRDDILAADIKQLEETIKDENALFTAPLLAKKEGLDKDGISTRLAKQFCQLFPGSRIPYVQLSEKGIQFYWKNAYAGEGFPKVLKAHGFKVSEKKESLHEHDEPNSQLREQYQDCYSTLIPHKQAEKLLRLAQYHPYNLKITLDDWYKSKKLNRALCLTKEALFEKKSEPLSIHYHEMERVELDDKTDLIKVSLVADIKESEHPHHVVVLLDDSGSMDGKKIDAALKALKKFIENLPSNTIVSIQPMNAKTLAYRMSVDELKKDIEKYVNVKATDGTPLAEILAASAALVRKDPNGFIISEEELNHTSIVLLTDGQDNNSRTAAQAITMMKNSKDFSHFSALQIPGMENKEICSYGKPNFPCEILPPILPVGISDDADSIFIDELAEHLHSPVAHVQTNKDIDKDTQHALDMFSLMRNRVPSCFIGLTYEADNKAQGLGIEEHNLFNHRSRDIYFTIPKEAKNINIGLTEGHKSNVKKLEAKCISDPYMIDEYVKQELLALQVQFSKKWAAFHQVQHVSTYSRMGRRQPLEEDKEDNDNVPSDHKEKQRALLWLELQKEILSAITKLRSFTKNVDLQGNLDLFKSQIEKASPSENNLGQLLSRADIANFTQKRILGNQAIPAIIQPQKLDPSVHLLIDALLSDFKETPEELIDKHKDWINVKQNNPHAATPLLRALVLLNDLKTGKAEHKKIEVTRQCILALIKRPEIQILDTDAKKMNALHRAAWYQEEEIVIALLNKAKGNDQLPQLLYARNGNIVGGTLGETPLDHIRQRFQQDIQHRLLNIIHIPLKEKDFPKEIDAKNINQVMSLLEKKPELLNQHIMQDNGKMTPPLIALIKYLSTLQSSNEKETIREQIIDWIVSKDIDFLNSDQAGNTTLHQAISHGEYVIAKHLLETADQDEDAMKSILGARNSIGISAEGHGGELPFHNLAAKGQEEISALRHLFLRAEMVFFKYLTPGTYFYKSFMENPDLPKLDMLKKLINYLALEKEHHPKKEIIDHDLMMINIALEASNRVNQWLDLTQAIFPHLENAQKVEFNHLATVYSKDLAGYNATSFLKASPLPAIRELTNQCQSLLSKDRKLEHVSFLLNHLKKIETCINLEDFNSIYKALFSKELSINLLNKHSTEIAILYNQARHVLTQYQAYLEGRLAPSILFAESLAKELKNPSIDQKQQAYDLMDYITHIKTMDGVLTLHNHLLKDDKFRPLREPSKSSWYKALDIKNVPQSVTHRFSDVQTLIAFVAIRNTIKEAEQTGKNPISAVLALKTANAFIMYALEPKSWFGRASKVKTLFSDPSKLVEDNKILEMEISALQHPYQAKKK